MIAFLSLVLAIVFSVQDQGTAWSRDCHAAGSVERAASNRSDETETGANWPTVLHVALLPVSIGSERRGQCAARDNTRWDRTGFRLYWSWKSRSRGGRRATFIAL